MYDCVYPSRTARFGTALIPEVSHVCLFSNSSQTG
ncbi:queuine tRNA-ribosyltransferase family protein [bacterium]|nr:queuine tRNA-ribosyltransferase family protein [bacterium]